MFVVLHAPLSENAEAGRDVQTPGSQSSASLIRVSYFEVSIGPTILNTRSTNSFINQHWKFVNLLYFKNRDKRYFFKRITASSLSLFPVAPILEHRESVKRFVSLQIRNLGQSVGLFGRGTSRRKATTYTNTE
jgi:hypothetical protein